jgi:hypothetical protein
VSSVIFERSGSLSSAIDTNFGFEETRKAILAAERKNDSGRRLSVRAEETKEVFLNTASALSFAVLQLPKHFDSFCMETDSKI